MQKLLLFFFFILMTLVGRAQDTRTDFVIKLNGDTLRGKIHNSLYQPGWETVRFQQGKTTQQFKPNEIAGYGRPFKQVLVSRQIGAKGSPEFVRSIAQGYLSLYAGTNAKQELRFYIQPADSAYLVEIDPLKMTLILNHLMGDCPALDFGNDATRQRFPYNQHGMFELVKTYNSCRQPTQLTKIVVPKTKTVFRFGIKLGALTSRFDFGPETQNSVNNKLSYQFGAALSIYSRSRFSTLVELNYQSLKNEFEAVRINPNVTTSAKTATLSLSYKQIQLPLLVRYQLTNGAARAFINAGPCGGINFNNTSTLRIKYDYLTQSETDSYLLPRTISVGYAAGAGVLFKITPKQLLSIEARFDHLFDSSLKDYSSDDAYYKPQHRNFHLDAGIFF